MGQYILKDTRHKGIGLFTETGRRKGEVLFSENLTGLRKHTLEDINSDPALNGDHAHYVGRGKYVIEEGLPAYMNHSCDPNCCYRKSGIGIYDVVALRDINVGEELTHDYAASSINQLEGLFYFEENCECGSSCCRRTIHGDFFRMPMDWQKRFYRYLPPSIKRKYRARFKHLLR
ncbi:MAG: SET domain-containing protein-lysine N-methyltransferase [Thermoplasmata archaeon]|nr:SET domain-containing protein-lysine N-methyltransferase [Thermoplasmata archaeon]